MEIVLTDNNGRGMAEALASGSRIASMIFSQPRNHFLIIEHTEVDGNFNGQGVGLKLLNAIVEMARANDLKVIAQCPYAKAMFEKYEELRDVLM